MEKLEDHINLELIKTNFNIPLLSMVGIDSAELEPVQAQLKEWSISIQIHNASLVTAKSIPALPTTMYQEVTDYCDATFPNASLVARAMIWYSICDALIRFSNVDVEQQLAKSKIETLISKAKELGLHTESGTNPLNN
jgi:hypothetical protein